MGAENTMQITGADSLIGEALAAVRGEFPFAGYMDATGESARNIAKIILSSLPTGSSVLDFGSGPCDKTAVLQKLGYRCTAIDDLGDDWHRLDDNRARILAFIRHAGIVFHEAPTEQLRAADGRPFDLLMLNDVLEHLHDSPRELMNSLVSLVRPGGHVLITVPNAGNIRKRLALLLGKTNLPAFELYYWQAGRWRGHVREYVRSDLRLLAGYLGLTVLELRGCDHMTGKVPAILRPLYRLVTGVFDGFKDTWMMLCRKPADWSPRLELPPEEFRKMMNTYNAYSFS